MSEQLLTKIFEKLIAMEQDVQALKNSMNSMKQDVQALKNSTNSMEQDVQTLKNSMNSMEQDVQTLKNSMNSMEQDVQTLNDTVATMATKDDIAVLETKMDKGFEDVIHMVNLLGQKTEAIPQIEAKLDVLNDRVFAQEADIRLLKKAK